MNLFLSLSRVFKHDEFSSRQFRQAWLFVLLLVSGIHLATMTFSPNVWVDEAQIVDYGRTTFSPQSDWSISWLTANGQPLPAVTYLGCVLQELAYRISGSPMGPRITSLIGALAAATLLVGWLRSRGTPAAASFLLGMLFVLDPYFTVSYRFARVDGWSLALCFGAGWFIRTAIRKNRGRELSIGLPLVVGAATAVNFFLWPTSAVFFPLLAAEFFLSIKEYEVEWKPGPAGFIYPVLAFAVGGTLTGLILLIPLCFCRQDVLTQVTSIQANNDYGIYAGLLRDRLVKNGRSFLSFCEYCPAFPIGILVGIFSRCNWKLWLALISAIVAISMSRVYIFRLIYLLPYTFCFLSYFIKNTQLQNFSNINRLQIRYFALLLLVAWATVLTVVGWIIAPLYWRQQTDMNALYTAGSQSIGSGPKKVYVDHSGMYFYYVGRKLGWRMYRPYTSFNSGPVFFADNQKLLPEMDYAIIHAENTYFAPQLEQAGLHFDSQLVDLPKKQDFPVELVLDISPYGPYFLYSRRHIQPSADRAIRVP